MALTNRKSRKFSKYWIRMALTNKISKSYFDRNFDVVVIAGQEYEVEVLYGTYEQNSYGTYEWKGQKFSKYWICMELPNKICMALTNKNVEVTF